MTASVSTKQVRAGRLELVPPAAHEFSPETSEEEIIVCCTAS